MLYEDDNIEGEIYYYIQKLKKVIWGLFKSLLKKIISTKHLKSRDLTIDEMKSMV